MGRKCIASLQCGPSVFLYCFLLFLDWLSQIPVFAAEDPAAETAEVEIYQASA